MIIIALIVICFAALLGWLFFRFTGRRTEERNDIFLDLYADLQLLEDWYVSHEPEAAAEKRKVINGITDKLLYLETDGAYNGDEHKPKE